MNQLLPQAFTATGVIDQIYLKQWSWSISISTMLRVIKHQCELGSLLDENVVTKHSSLDAVYLFIHLDLNCSEIISHPVTSFSSNKIVVFSRRPLRWSKSEWTPKLTRPQFSTKMSRVFAPPLGESSEKSPFLEEVTEFNHLM